MATVMQGHRAIRLAHNHQAGQHQVPIREVQAAHQAMQPGAVLIPILHLQEAAHPNRTQHLQEAVLRVAIRVADLHREAVAEAAVEAAVAADQDADDNKIALKKSLKEIKTMVLELAPIIGAGFTQPLKNIYK